MVSLFSSVEVMDEGYKEMLRACEGDVSGDGEEAEEEGAGSRSHIPTKKLTRTDFHPLPSTGPRGPRQGTPQCKCGIPA